MYASVKGTMRSISRPILWSRWILSTDGKRPCSTISRPWSVPSGMKVRRGLARSAKDDTVGGATLTFDVDPEHPDYENVIGLLRQVRSQVNELWSRVEACNTQRAIPEDSKIQVSFYFGQCVTLPDEE